ncbi:lipoyl(octanoyl) transferase LipB [Coxiella endosymbiont of Ornithodoros amblus]|uniref:lipoyl(octanoyl) transferase LipB n=1 Tax=Coxiella endosymbiont of Ornithodoros amblus TaxID=1656166 RepID=UPI00244DB6AF|nr:lipoyl(octanoyl) transferase LipB [Coxiella endosymbiont of Ornithodoros amblus]MBW5802837.1 lipoyl(octanoyl) transferase LipB [Coxiella endosymbiont of Ornithodoros amblus]
MNDVVIRQLTNLIPYQPLWKAMQTFTARRQSQTTDEIWFLEHEPVFTQGLAGKPEHVLNSRNIPLIRTDRGGQVTYHGPGQLMMYLLLDLNRLGLSTRTFVRTIENTIAESLQEWGIPAQGKEAAPGVYVDDKKICSIGLRVRKGFSYHGLALNVAMDLTPFSFINPCGFKGLVMAQIQDYVNPIEIDAVKRAIIPLFLKNFGYNQPAIMATTSLEFLIDDHLRSFSEKPRERETVKDSSQN